MDSYTWHFPLDTTHEGMVLGNGTMGAMIWGEGAVLRLTLGLADLWDHRGGMSWTPKQSFAAIRDCLERHDEPALRRLFETDTERTPGQPRRPSVLPVGRFEIDLGPGAELLDGEVFFKTGAAQARYRRDGQEYRLTMVQDMTRNLLAVCLSEKAGPVEVRPIPAWEFVGDYLETVSFEPPVPVEGAKVCGWVQSLPADPNLAVVAQQQANAVWIGTARADDPGAVRTAAIDLVRAAAAEGFEQLRTKTGHWWAGYWADVPRVSIPNERLDFLYHHGMYKFGAFTNPDGVPATLQGPWIEEYRMPPWSSDYHFNINVQMCYWPAYQSGKLDNLRPIFDLVWSWRDQLSENARLFVGIDDGFMLPHAVDDRCTCMGSFWTGTIDHACTAWIGIMMHEYAAYSGDTDFLRDRAFPFMKGAMRVYEQMLDWDGASCSLPVSVSPEYRGAAMDAWGRNASFQLACAHRLLECLQEAADVLGAEHSSSWEKVQAGLPRVCTVSEKGREVIALWEETALEESHRHHSHLGGICPFDVLDPHAEPWRELVSSSVDQWVLKGMGAWSGWCMPWASMIHSRLNNGRMAELLLEMWQAIFTNAGYASLHDASAFGLSIMGGAAFGKTVDKAAAPMQMDGAMGAVRAIQEMLMHRRRGVNYLFPGVPDKWRNASFADMACWGTVKASADFVDGMVRNVRLTARQKTVFRLGNPWKGAAATLQSKGGPIRTLSGEVLELMLAPGEELILTPASAERG